MSQRWKATDTGAKYREIYLWLKGNGRLFCPLGLRLHGQKVLKVLMRKGNLNIYISIHAIE